MWLVRDVAYPLCRLTARLVTEPSLQYLHMLAREPTLNAVQHQSRYQRDILSWRAMPNDFVNSAASASRKRSRDAAASSFAVPSALNRPSTSALPPIPQPSPLPLPPPPTPSPPRASQAPSRLPYETASTALQSSGLSIHPSLLAPAAPAPRRFTHPLDPLVIPPPAARRRKAVDRCTSPSHFLATPLSLTAYGPDAHIDLPLRARLDSWLGGCASLFFAARAPVVGDDAGKMWEEVGRDKPAYTTIERLLSPLRRRRVREVWSTREVVAFEAGMTQRPKDFAAISRLLGTKTTREVVAFYYTAWKHSTHYWRWKQAAHAAVVDESAAVDRPAQRVEIELLEEQLSDENDQRDDAVDRPKPTARPPLVAVHGSISPPTHPPSPAPATSTADTPASITDKRTAQSGDDISHAAPQLEQTLVADEKG